MSVRKGLLGGGLVLVAACVIGWGCGAGEADSRQNEEATTMATLPAGAAGLTAEGWVRVEGMHGDRYCEVLLANAVDGHLVAKVWNTYGLTDCPDEQWRSLDAAAIKEERGALVALLNGPRYWLLDAIERKPDAEREESMFGPVPMFLAATVDLGPIPPNLAPFTERHVARETVFEFAAGREVYELRDPAGRVFVMQSYSQINDASLDEADLASLGSLLKLPDGWSFSARTLGAPLRVIAPGGDAAVVQDELSNTYQLVITE